MISSAAEKLAANVGESRRGFLGHLGKAALGAAGVVGGLLLSPGKARAANGVELCIYSCPDGTTCSKKVTPTPNCGKCPKKLTCGGHTCKFSYCTLAD
jgi:hypothetical protein